MGSDNAEADAAGALLELETAVVRTDESREAVDESKTDEGVCDGLRMPPSPLVMPATMLAAG